MDGNMLSDVIISINTLAGVLIVSTFIGTIEADTCNAVTVTHGRHPPVIHIRTVGAVQYYIQHVI